MDCGSQSHFAKPCLLPSENGSHIHVPLPAAVLWHAIFSTSFCTLCCKNLIGKAERVRITIAFAFLKFFFYTVLKYCSVLLPITTQNYCFRKFSFTPTLSLQLFRNTQNKRKPRLSITEHFTYFKGVPCGFIERFEKFTSIPSIRLLSSTRFERPGKDILN